VTEDLIRAGAVMRIPDGDALGPAVVRLLSRDIERRTMGEAAHRVMERERGAVERTMAIVERVLAGEFRDGVDARGARINPAAR
jgi:3-deoxy-D-manno-octulosonic-acid transferase